MIIRITADGIISPGELKDWENILMLAENLQSALMSVKYADVGGERR